MNKQWLKNVEQLLVSVKLCIFCIKVDINKSMLGWLLTTFNTEYLNFISLRVVSLSGCIYLHMMQVEFCWKPAAVHTGWALSCWVGFITIRSKKAAQKNNNKPTRRFVTEWKYANTKYVQTRQRSHTGIQPWGTVNTSALTYTVTSTHRDTHKHSV